MDTMKNLIIPIITPISKPIKIKKIGIADVELNLSFKAVLIRFGILFLLPILAMLINKGLVIYTVPICMYLLTTALLQFCLIKYIWHRYVKHEATPLQHKYGQDPNYPDESL
jgi:hypothetical protein